MLFKLTSTLAVLATTTYSLEYFSSFQHVTSLNDLETDILGQFSQKLQEQQQRLATVREYIKELNQTKQAFIGNPVLQYKLIKRMVSQWPDIIKELGQFGHSMQEAFDQTSVRYGGLPARSDLDGGAEAVMRLQDTYFLDTKEFADGNIKGNQAPAHFDAEECFTIGRKAYLKSDFYHTILWMRESWRRIQNGDTTQDEFDVLDHLSYALSQWNLRSSALRVNARQHELIARFPGKYDENQISRAGGNKDYYETEMLKGNDYNGDQSNIQGLRLIRPPNDRFEFDRYEELCRAKDFYESLPQKVTDQLYCKYDTQNGNPRLLLKPAKVEIIRLNPTIVIFHDIVEPNEVQEIVRMAAWRLKRATIQNPTTGNLETADYRVSKHAWLQPKDGQVVQKLNDRIMDYTGLDTRGLAAEDLQINDYGIGGQYEPHYDHATKYTAGDFGEERGNRIATVLIYFSETELGGNTVFLRPKIVSRPKRGSAVFWYNLLPSGESDDSTRHAGCPILIGQKWVANYWIHERGQEFRRQCELHENAMSKFNIPGWKRDSKDSAVRENW